MLIFSVEVFPSIHGKVPLIAPPIQHPTFYLGVELPLLCLYELKKAFYGGSPLPHSSVRLLLERAQLLYTTYFSKELKLYFLHFLILIDLSQAVHSRDKLNFSAAAQLCLCSGKFSDYAFKMHLPHQIKACRTFRHTDICNLPAGSSIVG